MRSFLAAVLVIVSFVACGGGDDKPDALVFLDAPAALVGLGQKCGAGMGMCPQNAPGCLGPTGGVGFCTNLCGGTTVDASNIGSGKFTTDSATPPQPVPASIMPPISAWLDAPCQMIYTGAQGAGSCSAIINVMPMPVNNMFAANTNYTFAVACEIACGPANECPGGFTCNTAAMFKTCRVQ